MPFLRITLACALLVAADASPARAELRVGTALVDVTPRTFPVLVNGGMTSRSVETVKSPVNARALVLDDGKERLAIVVVDSCMMGRDFLDEAKKLAASRTKIKPERMLISATHTHSAPASMGCLGTDADPTYVPYLREKLAEAIAAAEKTLTPAKVGYGSIDANEFTALRQWIRRPDRVVEDPFGNFTVRANMHAGRNWDDAVGEAGPEDPELSLIAFQTREGRPLAVLANFSMHYFGDGAIGADYFGLFCDGLKAKLAGESSGAAAPKEGEAPFLGLLSHGCSGDIWRQDYTKPAGERREKITIDEYTSGLLEKALAAYKEIEYRDDADLAMAEARPTLKYRVADKQRIEWARRVVAEMGDRLPKNPTEVYAREQIILAERKQTEIVVQAVRIGEIGIATTPNETYAISGLKVKLHSPLNNTMVIELANGGDGYIPPPDMHPLGGYNTWAARSAGLEVEAEPKIVETAITLLEQVAGKPRRPLAPVSGPAAKTIEELKPVAYYRLEESSGPRAIDATGRHDAVYEPSVCYWLAGPHSEKFAADGRINRAPHFVGGRIDARLPELGDRYTISLWIWNGMPDGSREVAGWFASRGNRYAPASAGEHWGLAGAGAAQGTLLFLRGEAAPVAGRTPVGRWTWTHVAIVRDGPAVRAYVDGRLDLETTAGDGLAGGGEQFFFGGRTDGQTGWEGRLDEIAVFNRPLSADEIASFTAR
jgi:hypothetical protein